MPVRAGKVERHHNRGAIEPLPGPMPGGPTKYRGEIQALKARYLDWVNCELFAEPDWRRRPSFDAATSALVGVAIGYSAAQLRPLVETYREHCNGVAILATDRPQALRDLSADFGVGLVAVQSATDLPVQVNIGRFTLLHAIVRSLPSNIDRIMLADTRDVWLQDDPLRYLDHESMHFFSEANNPVLGSTATGRWLARVLGEKAVEPIRHRMMINNGIVIGPRDAVERHLHIVAMLAAIPRVQLLRLRVFSVDQALVNYVAHHRLDSNKSVHHRNLDVVANLYGLSSKQIELRAGVVHVADADGEHRPAVVHMWDRSIKLRAMVRDKWGLDVKSRAKSVLHYPRRWLRSVKKRIPELR